MNIVMLVPHWLALSLCFNALLLWAWDFLAVPIPFGLLTLIAFMLGLYFALPQRAIAHGTSSILYGILLFAIVILVALPYYGWSPWTYPFPGWDGANTLGIMYALLHHGSHRLIQEGGLSLLWGGDLATYPWAFSGFVVGISQLTTFEPVGLISICIFLFHVCISITLAETTRLLGLPPLVAITSGMLGVVSLIALVAHCYWTQLAGILVMACFIHRLGSARGTNLDYWCLSILAIGLGHLYPLLWIPAPLALFVWIRWGCSRSFLFAMLVSFVVCICSLISFVDSMPAHVNRLLHKGGPLLLGNVHAALVLVGISGALLITMKKLRRENNTLFLNFFVAAVFLAVALALYLLSPREYWGAKMTISAGIMVLPLLSLAAIELLERIPMKQYVGASHVFSVLGVAMVFLMLGQRSPSLLDFGTEDRMLAQCVRDTPHDARIFFDGHYLIRGWYEALVFPLQFTVPSGDRELITQWDNSYALVNSERIVSEIRKGDFVVFRPVRAHAEIESIFREQHRVLKIVCESKVGWVGRVTEQVT